jgi:hypothetical protein
MEGINPGLRGRDYTSDPALCHVLNRAREEDITGPAPRKASTHV